MLSIYTLTTLEAIYTKDALEKGLFHFARAFYLNNLNPDWADAGTQKITTVLTNKKSFSKPEMMTIAFSIFSNETVYKAFAFSLPIHLQKAIEILLWRECLTDKQLENLIDHQVSIVKSLNREGTISANELLPEFAIFSIKTLNTSISWANNNLEYLLSIDTELKKILVGFYPKPLHYYFIPLAAIPETAFTFNGHPAILEDISSLVSLSLQGNIKYTATGRPLESTLGRLQRSCSITEFYTDDNEVLAKLRTNLIAGLLFGLEQNNLSTDSVEIIKHLFQKHYLNSFSAQYILSQLKGWGFVNDIYDDNGGGVEEVLQNVLKELPENEWISSTNLLELIEHRSVNAKPIEEYTAKNKLYYDEEVLPGVIDKSYISIQKYNDFITNPFIKGTLFLYASFGLIELAYTSVDTTKLGATYFSSYDGLSHFKLTSLGAYVLGIVPSYTYTEPISITKLTLSNDSLIIIAEGNMAILEVMLNNYCEKLGNHRFRVTLSLFLKDCKTRKDVENMIASFKTTVNNTIPTYWEKFFKQLLNNASVIKINKLVQTYSLPINDKELHRMVAQDSILKQLVLKAEGFNLIVPNDNIVKLKARMKELGFIIE